MTWTIRMPPSSTCPILLAGEMTFRPVRDPGMATAFVSWRDVTYEKVASAGEGGIGKVFKLLD